MWIFNEDGFFSVVQDRFEDDKMLVRARVEADLTRLRERLAVAAEAAGMAINPDDIEQWKDTASDYHHRLVLPKEAWMVYLLKATQDIDYTGNIKGRCDQGEQIRHDAMMDVWTAMATIQEEVPWAGASKIPWPEDVAEVERRKGYTPGLWDDVNRLPNSPADDDQALDSLLEDVYGTDPEDAEAVADLKSALSDKKFEDRGDR